MSQTATRRWTLPLSLLLLVNAALVASAYWTVGQSSAPVAAPAASLVADPLPREFASQPGLGSSIDVAPAGDDSPPLRPDIASTNATDVPLPAEAPAAAVDADPWGDDASALPAPVLICKLPMPATPANAPDTAPEASAVVATPSSPSINLANGLPTAPAPVAEPPNHVVQALVIINPPATGGVVHFVVDEQNFSLAPGELQRLPPRDNYRVRYHRGDEFGDADDSRPAGVIAFKVTQDGWTLSEIGGPAAERLLLICVPAASLDPSEED